MLDGIGRILRVLVIFLLRFRLRESLLTLVGVWMTRGPNWSRRRQGHQAGSHPYVITCVLAARVNPFVDCSRIV